MVLRPSLVRLGSLAVLAAFVACGGGDHGERPRQDISGDGEDDAADGDAVGVVDIDIAEAPDGAEAIDANENPIPCEGCFGAPCDENLDCNSEYCVPGPDGINVCSDTCVNECPSAWSCRPVSTGGADVAFICIYDHTAYCAPCDGVADCNDPLGTSNATRCMDAGGGSGSFCATPCRDDAECPEGGECVVENETDEQGLCRPAAIDGARVCGCSAFAIRAGASTACTVTNGAGTCEGRRACADEGLEACDARTPAAERCNDEDDDCDGDADEDFPELGDACDSPDDADECALGTWACGPDGALLCDGDRDVATEVCNRRDDDCDGETDEELSDDGAPCDGEDADQCEDDAVRCIDGVNACVDAGVALTEICNGDDDDCDGDTDADDDELLRPSCEGDGVCADVVAPATLCQGGAWRACDAAAFATHAAYQEGAELACDGLDNDCDAAIDEDFSLELRDGDFVDGVGVPCGSGICAGGTTACGDDGLGIVCTTEAGAIDELCNGVDDDCDGRTDGADLGLATALCGRQAGVCAGSVKPRATCGATGFPECTDSVYELHDHDYEAGRELTCEGLDNDCDADADEDFPVVQLNGQTVSGIGKACGVGVCSGGFTVCDDDRLGAHCSSEENARVELCNGIDDDCDGKIDAADPDLQRVECEKQAGLCLGAMKPATLCQAGVWKPCATADYDAFAPDYEPAAETRCDDRDEDCDGQVDDDFQLTMPDGTKPRGVGTSCGSGGCHGGVLRCTEDDRGVECTSSGSVEPEVCDGVDNDCDGEEDGADPDMERSKCGNQIGLCQGTIALAERCQLGQWLPCIADDYEANDPRFESVAESACDGVDEDCNGQTDEDFSTQLPNGSIVSGVGVSCGAGACTGGFTACADDHQGIVCDSDAAAGAETCDGFDNDCDGLTDAQDGGLVLIRCDEQRGVCDGAIRIAELCVGGGWRACIAAVYEDHDEDYEGGSELSCDAQDNDCDGSTDEDFHVLDRSGADIAGAGKPCGAGACAGGLTECDLGGTGIVCPGDDANAPEECNFVDDDCDGDSDADDPSLVLDPCEETRGVCDGATHAAAQCSGGQWQACTAEDYTRHSARYEDGAETRCDGFDNDCDGGADEDIRTTFADGIEVAGVGSECGSGDCDGGATYCDAAGTGLECDSETLIATETCNSEDDDCDGETDAADTSLELILCGDQDGVCQGATRDPSLCVNGNWQGCGNDLYAAYSDRYEIGQESSCDSYDNDCDVATDEDFDYVQLNGQTVRGVGTSCGVGICAGGALVCNGDGDGVDCLGEADAVGETCNGDDDDCDGDLDASDASLAHPNCELTGGVCAGSTKPSDLCTDGTWDLCTTAVYSAHSFGLYDGSSETRCDGYDGDCNGKVDEDFPLTLLDGTSVTGIEKACGVGACADGETICNADKNGILCDSEHLATLEVCNAGDDDCDGQTDAADASLVRDDCSNQKGVCQGAKKLPARCSGGVWGACIAEDYEAHTSLYNDGVELACDAKDEDCDGGADEDFTWTDPAGDSFRVDQTCGKGECSGGTVVCSGTTAVTCTTANKAVAELCDNLDQDCEGVTDDGCDDDLDDYCDVAIGTTGFPPVCPHGGGDCDDTKANRHPTAPELCNNVDEDCDNTVDEQFSDCLAASCDGGGDAYSALTADTCPAGACVTPSPASCGLYTCSGGGAGGDVCAVICQDDAHCVASAHCDESDAKCKSDIVAGGACVQDSDCVQGHCKNGFCCETGDCCFEPANCPASYTTTPSCGTPAQCQGTRQDRACNSNMCAKSAPIDDDSACTGATQAITCPAGVPPRFCDATDDQDAPVCPTTCTADTQCSDGYHCDDTCVPDVVDGGACNETSDCDSGYCNSGFCCQGGTCCFEAIDCPASFTEPAVCDTDAQCDGHRVDRACVQSMCKKSDPIDDDTACDQTVVSNTCGDYLSVSCTGAPDQPAPPSCPTGCTFDDECDGGAHCDGTCTPDLGDGAVCDEASDCSAAHCGNDHCCQSGDCCSVAADCPASWSSAPVCNSPAICNGTRSDATCPPASHQCGTQTGVADDRACTAGTLASQCGFYPSVFCSGADDQDSSRPSCATTCQGDGDCDANAHCAGNITKVCIEDKTDGAQCTSASQCQSGHCQNGFCCDHGECCANTSDCDPDDFSVPASCTTPGDCQGQRFDRLCGGDKICVVSPTATADDSACSGIEANPCGNYPSIFCTSAADQPVRTCATSCQGEGDCDPTAYCGDDDKCHPDVTGGNACTLTAQCAAGFSCVDLVCCSTGCGGACRRCDLSGDGTCTAANDGTDLDGDCAGFDCTGATTYFYGFDGDTCFTKAPVTDAAATCGPSGQCRTRDELCAAQTVKGSATITCDDTCQDPVAGSCSGTSAGACSNVNAGDISCGLGICERTVPRCVNGADNTCVEGSPATEVCDGQDNDCDGPTDAADDSLIVPLCQNQKGACFLSKHPLARCQGAGGWAQCAPADYGLVAQPGGPNFDLGDEVRCDGLDNDCDDQTDEGCDDDGDDFCDEGMTTVDNPAVCPHGGGDCNDTKDTAFPGALERCDDLDNDCQGDVDELCDVDGDDYCVSGAVVSDPPPAVCPHGGGDCDDAVTAVSPAALEVCDDVDNDCAFGVDDGCDNDNDDYCDSAKTVATPSPSTCTAGGGDCNDEVPAVHPGVTDACDDVDNDCIGGVDTGCDDDNDNYCDSGKEVATPPPSTCTAGGGDCNDAPGGQAVNPAAIEICDNVDNDCAAGVDGGCDDDNDNYCDSAMTVGPSGATTCSAGGGDCDDTLATGTLVNPGRVERCNDRDDNCALATDEGCDNDDDGWCDAAMATDGTPSTCSHGGGDCADTNDQINPGANEICDDKDNECDNLVDEGCDVDGDHWCKVGAVVSGSPPACSNGLNDCNDNDAAVNPGATEICDSVDNNCISSTDEGCDDDNDNYCDSAMTLAAGGATTCTAGGGDCNDAPGGGAVRPGAADLCDGIDNDCAGGVDTPYVDGTITYDDDPTGAGLRKGEPCGVGQCTGGVVVCADLNSLECSTEGGAEVCDNLDNDCDAQTDEGCDDDNDNYCDSAMTIVDGGATTCSAGGGDCNDGAVGVHPNATETCDNVDNDCEGGLDEGCDDDNDNYCDSGMTVVQITTNPVTWPSTCTAGGGDCNDTPVVGVPVNPGATESCNDVNDDCDAAGIDEGCDDDNDNYCDSGMTTASPAPSTCTLGGGDCADAAGQNAINPGATEVCDDLDNDCNGSPLIDEGCDDDNDNYCDSGMSVVQITTNPVTWPSTCTAGGGDCADAAGQQGINPGVTEVCDNVDNDCNGSPLIDEGCDDDNDNYCDSSMSVVQITTNPVTWPSTCTAGGGDCADASGSQAVNPGATEICDNIDNDCNGSPLIDEGCDDDNDNYCDSGMTLAGGGATTCGAGGGDCNDGSTAVNPGIFDTPDDGFLDADCDGIDGDDATAIYVDCVSGNDGNSGTRVSPKGTITGGLNAQIAGRHVLVANRVCSVTTLTLQAEKSVHAGYTPGTWARSATKATISGGTTAVFATGITTTTVLDSFIITAAANGTAGGSSYGMRIVSSDADLFLKNLDVSGSNGGTGSSGGAGGTGTAGNAGTNGNTGGDASSCCGEGGAGGTGGCFGGGAGGRGGYGASWGSGGATGGTQSGHGAAGNGGGGGQSFNNTCDPFAGNFGCQNGGTGGTGGAGSNGSTGSNGSGGNGTGTAGSGGWSPSGGGSGGTGSHGGGGGGAGGGGADDCCQNDRGGGGGGGGSSGCGGGGGSAGSGGGGSFGIYLFNASPTMRNITARANFGGTGGAGGSGGGGGGGGVGGFGGSGPDDGGEGGRGGRGGDGGTGGHGGGGGGGISWCIYRGGTSTPVFQTTPIYVTGTPGNGGTGPVNGATGSSGTLF